MAPDIDRREESTLADKVTKKEMRTVLLSCLIGTAVEWYDFFL